MSVHATGDIANVVSVVHGGVVLGYEVGDDAVRVEGHNIIVDCICSLDY